MNLTSDNTPFIRDDIAREIVVAPPGCGKTGRLTRRLDTALKEAGKDPSRGKAVLCLTFTRNAAEEMVQRIKKPLPDDSPHFIGTLHAYCWRALREDARDDKVRLVLIDEHLQERFSELSGLGRFNSANEFEGKKEPEISLDKVTMVAALAARGEEITFESWRSDAWKGMVMEFAGKYNAFKKELDEEKGGRIHMDFHDVLYEALDRLRSGRWTTRFDLVLVDEVQDLTPMQLEIIELLVRRGGRICYYGDPQQAIYSFMGVNLKKLHELWNLCGEEDRHYYRTNFRTSPHLLPIINRFAQNRLRNAGIWERSGIDWTQKPSKQKLKEGTPQYGGLRLTRNKDLDEDIALIHGRSFEDELDRICSLIDSFPPDESNVILVRRNETVRKAAAHLKGKNRYVILSGDGREHVFVPRLMGAFMLACCHPEGMPEYDDELNALVHGEDPWVYLLEFLVGPAVRTRLRDCLAAMKERYGVTPLDVVGGRYAGAPMNARDDDKDRGIRETVGILRGMAAPYANFQTLRDDVREGRYTDDELNGKLCDFLAHSHMLLIEGGHLSAYQKRQWSFIVGRAKKALSHVTLLSLEERISIIADTLGRITPEQLVPYYQRPAIRVMTIHKAKGLGFDNVFMFGCDSSWDTNWDYDQPDEADRVFFVGMTRAKRRLVFSYSDFVQPDGASKRSHLRSFSPLRQKKKRGRKKKGLAK